MRAQANRTQPKVIGRLTDRQPRWVSVYYLGHLGPNSIVALGRVFPSIALLMGLGARGSRRLPRGWQRIQADCEENEQGP